MLLRFTFQSSSGHVSKSVFHVDTVKRTCLEEHHVVVLFRPLLAFGSRNLALIRLVKLVTETNKRESLGITRSCIVEEPTLPPVEVTERV